MQEGGILWVCKAEAEEHVVFQIEGIERDGIVPPEERAIEQRHEDIAIVLRLKGALFIGGGVIGPGKVDKYLPVEATCRAIGHRARG